MIVSCYDKTNQYVFDESNNVNEKPESQYLGLGHSKGTRENKLKEQWGEWIRRKTKTYTSNKTIEFKSVKDSQELKKTFK